ncbi:crotonase/enoyl-CoA hydratase family protein [Belnapia sp. T6]|uniref:Crotonase/enoyl-CoA hydratase family protein n=1 Tax=Belnapia mucosa TaxID=2804532 RepID=A0ABS1V3R3_9PROT|nr:crotonase/enoyl-CoA hydratase family protein [Belnapia mucosa]MBL6456330.1 crotonase/enoyl-CoA hydratase family protein [Belnapia mucosa]
MSGPLELAGGKVLVARDGVVTIITINRPERRNAVDNDTAAALTQAFRAFDADPASRVAVLTGAGGSFCAGADLKALADGAMYPPWAGDPDGPCHDLLSKPLIAAVEGYACAGGLGLALRCDLRVAAEGARFAVLSRRWGVPMSDGTTIRLPRLIGQGRALDMLLTAREVPAEEACDIGLADRLAPRGGALAAATELARLIAGFPQGAMRADRASLYAGLDLPLAEALARETQISAAARATEAGDGARRFADGAGRHGQLPPASPAGEHP